jgi:CheY-like chemotaxis protein
MRTPPPAPHDVARPGLRRLDDSHAQLDILVVDDDATIRTALVHLLDDEGHTTFQASDGVEALEMLRACARPLVVVIDWMMPHLNGMAVLQTVAADPVLARRHAYILTSAVFPAGLRHVAALPRNLYVDVLIQPINIQVLLAMVAHAADWLTSATEHPDTQR